MVEMSGRSLCLQITSPALAFQRKALTDSSLILYSLPKTEGRDGVDLDETDDGWLSNHTRETGMGTKSGLGTGPYRAVINNNNMTMISVSVSNFDYTTGRVLRLTLINGLLKKDRK